MMTFVSVHSSLQEIHPVSLCVISICSSFKSALRILLLNSLISVFQCYLNGNSFPFYFPAVSEDQAAAEEPRLTHGRQIFRSTKTLWEGVSKPLDSRWLVKRKEKERQMFPELPLKPVWFFNFSTKNVTMNCPRHGRCNKSFLWW